MTESQIDRVSAWRKAHRKLLDLPGLSLLELALLLVVERRGVRDVARLVGATARHDVGWSVRADGRPDTRRELAALVRLPPGAVGLAELDAAIAGLLDLGHLVVAEDGAVGMVGWAEQQESPDAARKRDARGGRSPDAAGTFLGHSADSTGTPAGQSEECPAQKTEDRGKNSPSPPSGVAPSPGAPRPSRRKPQVKPGPLDAEPPEVTKALNALLAERRRLGLTNRTERRRATADDLAKLQRPLEVHGVGWESWPLVARRMSEEIRRQVVEQRLSHASGAPSGRFFTLEHLSRPDNFGRYLERDDLDFELDDPRPDGRARGSPPGRQRPPDNDDLPPEVPSG